MKKRVVAMLMMSALVISLSACGGDKQADTQKADEETVEQADSDEAEDEDSDEVEDEDSDEGIDEADVDHQALDISGCDTFTQIVDQKLKDGMGYANAKIGDTDVLLVSSGTYDNNAGEGEAFEASIDSEIYYYTEDGKIGYMGYVTAGGTAYPLAIKDGLLYVGSNHWMKKYSVDSKKGKLVMKEATWVDYDNDGDDTYKKKSGENGKEKDVDEKTWQSGFDDYSKAELIEFSKVTK